MNVSLRQATLHTRYLGLYQLQIHTTAALQEAAEVRSPRIWWLGSTRRMTGRGLIEVHRFMTYPGMEKTVLSEKILSKRSGSLALGKKTLGPLLDFWTYLTL